MTLIDRLVQVLSKESRFSMTMLVLGMSWIRKMPISLKKVLSKWKLVKITARI